MLGIYLFENTLEARRAEFTKQVMDRETKHAESRDSGGNDFRRLKERLRGKAEI